MTDFKVAVGVGCDRHTPLKNLQLALSQALSLAGLQVQQIAVFASIEAKSDEIGILQLAQSHPAPIRFYSSQQLAAVTVPNPSSTVFKYMGTPSVSEAAAILAGNGSMQDLLVEKYKYCGTDGKNATISIARIIHD